MRQGFVAGRNCQPRRHSRAISRPAAGSRSGLVGHDCHAFHIWPVRAQRSAPCSWSGRHRSCVEHAQLEAIGPEQRMGVAGFTGRRCAVSCIGILIAVLETTLAIGSIYLGYKMMTKMASSPQRGFLGECSFAGTRRPPIRLSDRDVQDFVQDTSDRRGCGHASGVPPICIVLTRASMIRPCSWIDCAERHAASSSCRPADLVRELIHHLDQPAFLVIS